MKGEIIEILKLPDVPNICREILREVWSFDFPLEVFPRTYF